MRAVVDTTDRPQLVINADDFGFTEHINRGIIEAYVAGALRSTSIMVGMPAFDDAVQRARKAGPGLGVGLHFTLTAGTPLTHATSLVDAASGRFLRFPALLARALAGRVRPGEVAEECAAQVQRARAAGIRLTHLDGHHHVHLVPGIRDAVRAVVEAERIPVVRRPVELLRGSPAGWRRLPERALLALLARQLGSHWRARTADHFVGSALLGAAHFGVLLIRLLDTLPSGTTELMVHPGYVPEPLPGNDRYTTQREAELSALTSADVLARLHGGRIHLTHFGELALEDHATVHALAGRDEVDS